MGLFDTVKLKATALAADAERAGKITAAQARTVGLQSDVRKAERELGNSAFALIERSEIAHPDLEAAGARLREARQALKDKEAEIAGLRGRAADAEAGPTPEASEAVPPEPTTAAPIAEAPEPVEAAAGAAKKRAAARKPTAAKKSARKIAAPTKRAAKKPPAARKPAPAKKPPPADA